MTRELDKVPGAKYQHFRPDFGIFRNFGRSRTGAMRSRPVICVSTAPSIRVLHGGHRFEPNRVYKAPFSLNCASISIWNVFLGWETCLGVLVPVIQALGTVETV